VSGDEVGNDVEYTFNRVLSVHRRVVVIQR
jgi:hypothetical protein